jgi:hypothetical protein
MKGIQKMYQLKNGATIEDFLIAIHTAWSFETTHRGHDLLVAMKELLFSIKNNGIDPDYLDVYGIEPLENSFLMLFRMWLRATGFKVPILKDPTMDDAFTVVFGVGEAQ